MKILFLIFLFLQLSRLSIAQNYLVGMPVNTSLASFNYVSPGVCANGVPDLTITFPASQVSGIEHLAILTDVSQTVINIETGDTLQIGDTIIFSAAQNYLKLKSIVGFSIQFDFRAIGTPEIVGEPYICEELLWFDGLSDCDNFLQYQQPNTFCFVSELLEEEEEEEEEFSQTTSSISTHNTTDFNFIIDHQQLKLLSDKSILNCSIFDLFGKIMTIEKLNSDSVHEVDYDISSLPNGVYILYIELDAHAFRKKIYLVNQ